jgi:hypothetical protein
MIIGTYEIHDVAALLDGLGTAARGLVRVVMSTDGRATRMTSGWLVTDGLVMVPMFAVEDHDGEFDCHQGETTVPGRIVAQGDKNTAPALLRLAEPFAGQALRLATATPAVGELVHVLQHPQGKPAQGVSMGRLLHAADDEIRYDADTLPGSSGGPVLGAGWTVIGMHVRGSEDKDDRYNAAITVAAMREALESTPLWPEIAEHQGLADAGAMQRALTEPIAPPADAGDELLAAAVRWDFDRSLLSERAATELEPLVARGRSARWVLPAATRIAALEAAGSLDALRAARGDEPIAGPGQAVIDRILEGPPYALGEVDETALPYWLQATRWFAGVVPGLPRPDEVRRTLAGLRVHSRLQAIRGTRFRGRDERLAEIRAWHADPEAGPMVVTGIGGVGKSALVAAFALSLPPRTLQLWLDFDRADLAPDDPESVLRLLFEQMAAQLDGFAAPPLEPSTWPDAVAALGPALAPHLAGAPPPFLVLDGFEVAQHALEHREIWRLLEKLLPALPGLRVVVSGRAPVRELTLGGRPAHAMHLDGLARPDAVAWLLEQGFEHERIANRLADITRGVPLGLRLAVRWREEGGDEAELPDEGAPQWYIDGFLYKRILDRVMDPELVELAKDALVLRRLTPEMIPAVLADSAPAGDPDEVFARLARELALVGEGGEGTDTLGIALPGTGVLRLRPEVRSATLQLLSTEDEARVRTIDERAAGWYAASDREDVANAAELVYHRLRLGDVDGAQEAWRDGCATLLAYSVDEVPAGAPQDWLRTRSTAPPTDVVALGTWEGDARGRIVELLQRGNVERVTPILAERPDRSPGSPLVLYDALVHRWQGEREQARAVLAGAVPAEGLVGRDRAVAAAWLAAEAGDREAADGWLGGLDRPDAWADRQDPVLDALTVSAGRVRLRTDVATELWLAERLQSEGGADPLRDLARRYLPRADTVMPVLAGQLGASPDATAERVLIPRPGEPWERFASTVDHARRGHGAVLALQLADEAAPAALGGVLALAQGLPYREAAWSMQSIPALAELAWRRWRYALESAFLELACELVMRAEPASDPQVHAVTGTLAAFATPVDQGEVALEQARAGPIADLFARLLEGSRRLLALGYGPAPPERQIAFADRLLAELELPPLSAGGHWAAAVHTVAEACERIPIGRRIALLHVLSPDPLELLVRRIAGVSDGLEL